MDSVFLARNASLMILSSQGAKERRRGDANVHVLLAVCSGRGWPAVPGGDPDGPGASALSQGSSVPSSRGQKVRLLIVSAEFTR